MNYRDQLRPWAIFECLPDGHNICVARLRIRSDAEAPRADLVIEGDSNGRLVATPKR